jgi:hypothetical protein
MSVFLFLLKGSSLSRDFIGAYMKLAVEAFTQNQKRHSVHMEIVAASWAFA